MRPSCTQVEVAPADAALKAAFGAVYFEQSSQFHGVIIRNSNGSQQQWQPSRRRCHRLPIASSQQPFAHHLLQRLQRSHTLSHNHHTQSSCQHSHLPCAITNAALTPLLRLDRLGPYPSNSSHHVTDREPHTHAHLRLRSEGSSVSKPSAEAVRGGGTTARPLATPRQRNLRNPCSFRWTRRLPRPPA